MINKELTFQFKGERNYIQGPDIFDLSMNFLADEYPSIVRTRYSAHKMLHSNADIIVTDERIKEYHSLISFESNGDSRIAYIIGNNKSVKDRRIFDETKIWSGVKMSEDQISRALMKEHSLSELAVSLMKKLCQETIDSQIKWIVTKIEFKNYNEVAESSYSIMTIKITSSHKGRLAKSLIICDDKVIGQLLFSAI
ncbi:hypothetical protein [Ekhidna sp.]|uniref:hypothetical protein n=1 Tax=Ekhidna sp. TaxID=2608089 RepID=UPI003C7B85AC